MQGGGRRRRRYSHERVRWRRIATTTRFCRYPCSRCSSGCTPRRCDQRPRDGRLPVIYDTRTTFRRLRARATPAAARAFRRSYYGRTVRPDDRRAPLTWSTVPVDYDVRIRAVRRGLGLSQARFAAQVGAARKAVVYQWEARKRCPSPVFWQRIEALLHEDPLRVGRRGPHFS